MPYNLTTLENGRQSVLLHRRLVQIFSSMPKVHWLRTELMRNNVLTNSGTHLLEPVRDGITTIFCICLRCLLYREITGSIRNDD